MRAESVKPVKKQSEYQGYRAGPTDQSAFQQHHADRDRRSDDRRRDPAVDVVTALGSAISFEGPTEESAWLIDRLTGNVFRC